MRRITDSAGTRWDVTFISRSPGGAREEGGAFPEVTTDTIMFTAADGQKVERATIAILWGGLTNKELVRLLEETPEDQGN